MWCMHAKLVVPEPGRQRKQDQEFEASLCSMRPSLPQKIKEEEGEEMYFFQVLGMRDDIHQNFAKIVSSH